MFRGAAQDGDQLVVSEWLLDVIEGAFVHRLHSRLQRRLRRHQDYRTVWIALSRGCQYFDAGNVWHPNVGEHDVGRGAHEVLERLLAPLCEQRGEALVAEKDVQRVENARLVIHDEDAWLDVHTIDHLELREARDLREAARTATAGGGTEGMAIDGVAG